MTVKLTPGKAAQVIDNPQLLLYDPEIGRGYLKIKSDVEMRNGQLVQLKAARWVTFTPRYEQSLIMTLRNICRKRGVPTSIVVAKARDMGLSAIAAYLMVAEMSTMSVPSLSCLSVLQDTLKNPVRQFLIDALQSLPEPFAVDVRNPRSMMPEFTRDSPALEGIINLISAESGENVGVGTRSSFHWISERAKFKRNADIMRTFNDTLFKGSESFRLVESTCEGKANEHYEEFIVSWEAQGSCNPDHKRYKANSNAPDIALMIPWFYSEDRVLPLVEGITADMFLSRLDDYEKEQLASPIGLRAHVEKRATALGLSSQADIDHYCAMKLHYMRCYSLKIPEFRHYLDEGSRYYLPLGKISRAANTFVARKKEAPWNVDEAFTDEANTVFRDETMAMHKHNIRTFVNGYIEDNKFVESDNGWLKLWLPNESGETDREITRNILRQNKDGFPRLIAFHAFDFANGDRPNDEATDFSAGTGWTHNMRQLYEIEVREKATDFSKKVWSISRWVSGGREYREPYECVEYASAGLQFVQDRITIGHPFCMKNTLRFFYSHRYDKTVWVEDANKPGFQPNAHKQNEAAWAFFENTWQEDGLIVVRSQRLFDQIKFLKRVKGTLLEAAAKGTNAKDGSKDDLADTCKMALWHVTCLLGGPNGDPSSLDGSRIDPHGRFTHYDIDELDVHSDEAVEMRRRLREQTTKATNWWE